MTVLDLIKSSLRALNVIAVEDDVVSPEADEALDILNMMLGQWNNMRMACYQIVQESWPILPNVGVYTIGESAAPGNWNTQRPVGIDSMFVRDTTQTNPVDYTLRPLTNDQYQQIMLKAVETTYPYLYLYTPAWPLATITLYPYPSVALTLFLNRWSQISEFTSLMQQVSFPPGYSLALRYNLAVDLASYHNPPTVILERVEKRARETLASIKRVNAKEPIIAELDSALTGRRSGFPNIYTG